MTSDDTTMIAVHEAGHAVVARALGIRVTRIEWPPTQDGRAITTTGKPFGVRTRLAALQVDCKIMLAGPLSEMKYAHLHGLKLDQLRAWKEEWSGDASNLLRAVERAHRVKSENTPHPPHHITAMVDEVFPGVIAATAELIEQRWSAIERVAAALLRDGRLTQSEIDGLIADATPRRGGLVPARPEEYGRVYVIGGQPR